MTFKRNNLSQDVIHALTLTLVLCLTLLSGCSDKEEILPPEPEEGTDIVSEYKAYVGHPFNASLGEQTNGYTIKNNDPEKLKTEYFGIEHFGVVCIFPLLITQLFFDVREYLHFVDRLSDMGVSVPVIPGILPIQSLESIRRTLSLCGANIPGKLYLALEEANAKGGAEAVREAGLKFAVQQIRTLLDNGAPGIHLYTLNKASMCLRIAEEVGAL